MKALSLWQPWASLVVAGIKRFETRSWYTSHRGVLAIHAIAPPQKAVFDIPSDVFVVAERLGFASLPSMPSGVILGTVEVVACREMTGISQLAIPREQLPFGDFSIGRYAWMLRSPLVFETFFKVGGNRKLWDWEAPNEYLNRSDH